MTITKMIMQNPTPEQRRDLNSIFTSLHKELLGLKWAMNDYPAQGQSEVDYNNKFAAIDAYIELLKQKVRS
jgi:hypothetical protein